MDQRSRLTLTTPDIDELAMTALAGQVASSLETPLCIYFQGDLGAGKTTFIRALIHALGYEGRVKSPTYALMEQYELESCNVLHLDLYRIGDPDELAFLGLADLLGPETLLLVEWPGNGEGGLPVPDLVVAIGDSANSSLESRQLNLYAYSDSGEKLCQFIDSQL